MNISKVQRGKQAEDIAAGLLKNHSYQILARNIRFYGVEIDFICKNTKEETYTFFEVKNTKMKYHALGFPSISYKQQTRYQNSINHWFGDIQKILTVSIGLIIFDEHLQLIEFHKNLLF